MSTQHLTKDDRTGIDRSARDRIPRGIAVTRDRIGNDPVVNIAITASRYPLWLTGLIVGIPLLWVIAGITVRDGLYLSLFAFAFLLLAALVFVPDLRTGREIELTESYITVTDPLHRNLPQSLTMKLEDVKRIEIARPRSRIGHEVLIVGRDDRISVGRGLSLAALEWLQNFLIAAVARA